MQMENEIQELAPSSASACGTSDPESQAALSLETPVDGMTQADVAHAPPVRLPTPVETSMLAFPESGYLGAAAKFADLFSRHYESPKVFLYIDLLAIIGVMISGRFRADIDLPVQPRLYVLKIAQSAWKRKSTSTKLADNFIRSILGQKGNGQWRYADYESPVIYGVGSAEGLGTRLVADTENTGILGMPVTTRHAALLYDEFRRFEAKSSIEGSALRPMVNELFESNQYENLTKNNPLRIVDGHLGFLSNTTEETYRNLLASGESIDLGFLNRFFLVVGSTDRRIARPKSPPESELAAIGAELEQYFADLPPLKEDGSASNEIVIPLTPAAETRWERWYVSLEETPETARLDSLGMRLMGLLAFTSGQKEIDEDLVDAVLSILDYQRRVRTIYRPNTGENPAARMERKIKFELSKRPLAERDLRRHTNADRSGINVFRAAMNSLINIREIRLRKEDKKFELVDLL
jgi:Protein of unknown function (DUF3987)